MQATRVSTKLRSSFSIDRELTKKENQNVNSVSTRSSGTPPLTSDPSPQLIKTRLYYDGCRCESEFVSIFCEMKKLNYTL